LNFYVEALGSMVVLLGLLKLYVEAPWGLWLF
jgi:hypothetical protein